MFRPGLSEDFPFSFDFFDNSKSIEFDNRKSKNDQLLM